MVNCLAIQRNGRVCNCPSYDDTGRCGRHGGISQRQWRRMMMMEYHRLSRTVPKKLVCSKKDGDCMICFDTVVDCLILPCCKQTSCSDCLQGWLNTDKQTCPHCRKNLYDLYAIVV